MAKKNLTPEELQAKLDKKANHNKIFFGTFAKALAVFLAVVVAWSLLTIAFTGPSVGGVVVNGGTSSDSSSDDFGSDDFGSDDFGSDDATTDDTTTDDGTADDGASDDANTPSGDSGATDNGGSAAKPSSKAEVIKLLNAETAKAAKGSYKLSRVGKIIKPIDVGSATKTLNSIIQGVDANASLDSVVGGFLGLNKPVNADVKNGKGEGFDSKYMLKAMNLTEADVTAVDVNGDKYTIRIKDCKNPNASSALAHASNDYITFAEVNKSIANEVGTAVKVDEGASVANYKNIIFTATIVNGKLTNLEYSLSFDATLKLKITLVSATGTGEASITGKYTNITY